MLVSSQQQGGVAGKFTACSDAEGTAIARGGGIGARDVDAVEKDDAEERLARREAAEHQPLAVPDEEVVVVHG